MKKILILIFLTACLLLAGCSANPAASTATADSQTDITTQAASTAAASTAAATTAAETTAPADLVLPIADNTSGAVQIQTVSKNASNPFNSYIISSIEGENVIVNPSIMPKKDVIDLHPALIASTHPHPDHTDEGYTKSYDCPKILFLKNDISTKDFHVYAFPSSHSDDVVNEDTFNVIIVFEVDGLRIAHMGDVGQTTLTEDQLTQLGKIDIAFMQFDNSISNMTVENEKGFNLIEQLNPTIIIPTHYNDKAVTALEDKYGPITHYDNVMTITKDTLPEGTLNVCMISNTHKYS